MKTAINLRAPSRQLTNLLVILLMVSTAMVQSGTVQAQTDHNLPTVTTSTTSTAPTSTNQLNPINPDRTEPAAPTTSTPTSTAPPIPDTSPTTLAPNTITSYPSTTSTTLTSVEQNSPTTTTTPTSSTTIPWTTITEELGNYPSIKNIQLQTNQPVTGISLFTDGTTRTVNIPDIEPPLPDNLSISDTGQLTGTPTEPHTYTVHRLTCNPSCPKAGFGLEVLHDKVPIIAFPSQPYTLTWSVNDRVDHSFWHIRGGRTPYTLNIEPQLPSGLYLDTSDNRIKGQAISEQISTAYTLTVRDNLNRSDRASFNIVISGNAQPSFPSTRLEARLSDFEDLSYLPVASGGDGQLDYAILPYRNSNIISQYNIRLVTSTLVTITTINGRRVTVSQQIPKITATVTGDGRELGRIFLSAIDENGDSAEVVVTVIWELDSVPRLIRDMPNLNFYELVYNSKRIPRVISGNPPFTFELGNEENLISGFTIWGRKQQYHSLDEITNLTFVWRGQNPELPEMRRTTFTLIITDRNGDVFRDDFDITVRNTKPTLKTNLDNVSLTWVANRPIDPVKLEIEEQLGRPCVSQDRFPFPAGINVNWIDRQIVITGTPFQTLDRTEIPFDLMFSCIREKTELFRNRYELSVEIEPDYPIQIAPHNNTRAAWQRGEEIDRIVYTISNGNVPFGVDVSPDLPIGVEANEVSGEDCNQENTVDNTGNIGGEANSAVVDTGYCIIISGTPAQNTEAGEQSYSIIISDNGNETITEKYTGRMMDRLLPDKSEYRWLIGLESTHSLNFEKAISSDSQLFFEVTKDALTSDWVNFTYSYTESDGKYHYRYNLGGVPSAAVDGGKVTIEATTFRCEQGQVCQDYQDDRDRVEYTINVVGGSDLIFPGLEKNPLTQCWIADKLTVISSNSYTSEELTRISNIDGTIIDDINPLLPLGLTLVYDSTPNEITGMSSSFIISGVVTERLPVNTVFTLAVRDNNDPARLSSSALISSFSDASTRVERACYEFTIVYV